MRPILAVTFALLALVACNKAAPTAPVKAPEPVAPAAEKPGVAAEAPGSAAAERPPEAAVVATAEAAKAGCGPDCTCTDHSKCADGKCAGCAGKKAAEGEKAGEGEAHCPGATAEAKDGAAEGAAGCGGVPAGDSSVAAAPTAAPGATAHFGDAFSMDEAATPLDDIIAKADEFNGKTVKVAANVTKVCKKKGCWFVLEGNKGDGSFVRVTMKGYSFFVPLDADGKKAVVEGVFRKVDVPEAARKHLAEDGKEDPTKIQGSTMELTLVANGVDLEG